MPLALALALAPCAAGDAVPSAGRGAVHHDLDDGRRAPPTTADAAPATAAGLPGHPGPGRARPRPAEYTLRADVRPSEGPSTGQLRVLLHPRPRHRQARVPPVAERPPPAPAASELTTGQVDHRRPPRRLRTADDPTTLVRPDRRHLPGRPGGRRRHALAARRAGHGQRPHLP